MRLIIEKDYDQLSKWAAEHVIERINKFNPTPDHKFVLGLPTGSSPIGMYHALAEAPAFLSQKFLSVSIRVSSCRLLVFSNRCAQWAVREN